MKFENSLKIAIIVSLAVGLAGSVNAGPQGFGDPTIKGPYEVGFTSFMLTDASRNQDIGGRPIPVYLWYPADAADVAGVSEAVYPLDPINSLVPDSVSSNWEVYGFDSAFQEPQPSADGPFPLVVFSPGWGAHAFIHLHVGTRLASHGIAVAVVYHWGDAFWFWEPWDHLATACLNRPLDVSYTLTDLLARNADTGDLVYNMLSPDQVAASGWSLGGYAAMTLAGGDDLVCDKAQYPPQGDPPPETCVPSPPDPRFNMIIPLDGSTQVLYFQEMARITVPTMGIGQEWSTLYNNYGPEMASWQARLHAATQGHPRYRVDVADAYHTSFSNACEFPLVAYDLGIFDEATRDFYLSIFCAPPIPTHLAYELITQYMISFVKTNLEGEQGYQPYLTSGYALRDPYHEFFVTERKNPNSIDDDWPDDFIYFMHQPGNEKDRAPMNPSQSISVEYVGLREIQ
jgi:hypothetical protein